MRAKSAIALAVVTAGLAAPAAAADDPLVRARLLYNERRFDAAVAAAEEARQLPSKAQVADLVAGRAYLERFRESQASDDLTNARERFRRLSPAGFPPRERGEYIVGLGETLFFDEAYGAAADVFDSALRSVDLEIDARERVLDWWATAIDRDARPRAEADRQAIYQRTRARMQDELAVHPESGTAAYWLAAAARGHGDLQGAWDAALAGWARAPLAGPRAALLREDLDRLVVYGIIPERVKAAAATPDALKLQWDQFKEKWRP
jgi:tetratricopeptide (TPR) repeat protein